MKKRLAIILVICLGFIGLVFFSTGYRVASSSGFGNAAYSTPSVLGLDDVFLPIIVRYADGSDCVAIQNAIDSLPSTGGQVIISTGIFTCTTAIVIDKDNVDLRGQGSSTVLYLADGANSPVLVVGQTTTPPTVTHKNIRISDLYIDGNRLTQIQECWGGPCDSGDLTYIRNNGITLRQVSDVQIEHVTVVNARSGGLVAEKGCQRISVRDFSSAYNQFDGIAAYETENSIFSELHLYDNQYAGLSLDIRFNNNIISNVILTNNGKQGIFMRDSQDNLFSDIQIRGSGEQGLFLAQVDFDTDKPASGNTFSGLVVSESVQAGMRVNDASCIDNVVIGAQFVGNQSCISESTSGIIQQIGVICR